jgi:glycosyltransferase involved in cell wall biosynthesis
MYCGSCTRDNALARELLARGHDVTLVPVYTPTRPDEPNVSRDRVLFGGISVYLQQHVPLFRRSPRLLDRLWDSPRIIGAFASRAISTDARMLGDLTISMLQGERGVLRKEFDKLIDWIRDEPLPEIINLPNSLLIALAAPLKRVFQRPVCCTLQGEELFLDELVPPFRERARALIREQTRAIDRFVAVSDYCAAFMSSYLAIPPSQISVVPLGINMEGYEKPQAGSQGVFTVGYFARIAPEKGLQLLAEAYVRLRQRTAATPMRLEVAGYLPRAGHSRLRDAGGSFRIAASSTVQERLRSCASSTSSPSRPRTMSPRACSCWKRWPAASPWCSHGAERLSKWSSVPAGDCWSHPTTRTLLRTGSMPCGIQPRTGRQWQLGLSTA